MGNFLFRKPTTALCEKMVPGWKAGGMPSENQKQGCLHPVNHDGKSNGVTWIKYQFLFLTWELLFWKSTTALCEKMVLGQKAGGMLSGNQEQVCLHPVNHDGKSNGVTWIKYQCFLFCFYLETFGIQLQHFVKRWFLVGKQVVCLQRIRNMFVCVQSTLTAKVIE